MSTQNVQPAPFGWGGNFSKVLSLQIWWLLLIAAGAAVTVLLVYLGLQGSSDVERYALISVAAMFLAGMILSTLAVERAVGNIKVDHPFIWLARLRCTMAMGIAAVIAFAVAPHGSLSPVKIASVGVLSAGAVWIAGMVLGFIFGLPHRATGEGSVDSGQGQAEKATSKSDGERLTNLDLIGDWLTKLILGAGLTQVTKLPDEVSRFAAFMGKGMGDGIGSDAFTLLGTAICVFFFPCGFLFGYLWGRLFTPSAFRLADNKS